MHMLQTLIKGGTLVLLKRENLWFTEVTGPRRRADVPSLLLNHTDVALNTAGQTLGHGRAAHVVRKPTSA